MSPSDGNLRQRYLEILMDQVRDCKYPSPTMMDRIESTVTDRESAEEYVHALVDLVAADRYPSLMLLDRVKGLIDALEAADFQD